MTVCILSIGVITVQSAFARCVEAVRISEDLIYSSMVIKKDVLEMGINNWISTGATSSFGSDKKSQQKQIRGLSFEEFSISSTGSRPTTVTLLFNVHSKRTTKEIFKTSIPG